jgi:hypothetical protein
MLNTPSYAYHILSDASMGLKGNNGDLMKLMSIHTDDFFISYMIRDLGL